MQRGRLSSETTIGAAKVGRDHLYVAELAKLGGEREELTVRGKLPLGKAQYRTEQRV